MFESMLTWIAEQNDFSWRSIVRLLTKFLTQSTTKYQMQDLVIMVPGDELPEDNSRVMAQTFDSPQGYRYVYDGD